MRVTLRVAIVALAATGVFGLPAPASAQFGYSGYPGGYGGFGGYGGYGGFGGLGGLGGLGNQQLLQQLPPQNLRNNWYMYDSIGGMGRTGGTVQIVTQFGLQSQQGANNNNLGGFGGYGGYPGGGYGGFPAYYGVNYQRALAQAQLVAAYQANAYRMSQMNAQANANSTASYSSFTPSATPKFGSFGFADTSRPTGFGAFNPPSFQPKKDETNILEPEKKEKDR
jgi:hypothetical protein